MFIIQREREGGREGEATLLAQFVAAIVIHYSQCDERITPHRQKVSPQRHVETAKPLFVSRKERERACIALSVHMGFQTCMHVERWNATKGLVVVCF